MDSPVKYIRRTASGKYEHGHVILGITRDEDKYVKTGIVGTYEAAANASKFEPVVPHNSTSGGTYYEDLHHSRNQGHHSRSKVA